MIDLGAVDIAGGIFSGGAAIMLLRWAINLFFLRVNKREDRVDAGMAELLTRLTEQVKALTASEEALRIRVAAAEATLHDCQVRHAESEKVVQQLLVQVAQLRALPTNEGELP